MRQESHISTKYFRRGKEMCSFDYRLLPIFSVLFSHKQRKGHIKGSSDIWSDLKCVLLLIALASDGDRV